MWARFRCVWLLSGLLCLSATAVGATEKTGKVYRWTDDKGVVHYGDAVPPQYADQDQTILNRQGLPVGSVAGHRSAEQLAADDEARAADASVREAHKAEQLHDKNLLATYLSVTEIEALRDRRVDILEGQARVITQYLEQLKTRRADLEAQMRHYRPYANGAMAPALPERLAEEVVRTIADAESQQRSLAAKQSELQRTRDEFAADIARFRQLKDGGRAARPLAR